MIRSTTKVVLIVGSFIPFLAQADLTSEYLTKLVDTCHAIKSNHQHTLRKTLMQNNLTMDEINEKLMCNGESAYEFAITHKAMNNAKMLNRTGTVTIKEIAAVQNSKSDSLTD
ncbi:DUF3718 domain-containing protein [Algicola sagamiensis]|uniref:DUF3718 domain-containing protein n=1 Tax=Algicola sagamiensis TaxID=163869 RepID=UPI00037BDC34|nr:DUF3718 domain-containing protein [Algicola sagamiensis]